MVFITSSLLLEVRRVSSAWTGSWLHSRGGWVEKSSLIHVKRRLLRCFQDASGTPLWGGVVGRSMAAERLRLLPTCSGKAVGG